MKYMSQQKTTRPLEIKTQRLKSTQSLHSSAVVALARVGLIEFDESLTMITKQLNGNQNPSKRCRPSVSTHWAQRSERECSRPTHADL